MIKSRASEVKKERKKSLFLREISRLIMELGDQESLINGLYVTRVDVSADTGICYVYFTTYQEPGDIIFKNALSTMILYKPSIRKALGESIKMRYTPDLVFLYDAKKEKERHINKLLDKVQDELIAASVLSNNEK